MKKALILGTMLLLITGSANAAKYVGLYSDAEHSLCTVTIGMYQPFDCYVYMVNQDGTGIQAAEYRIILPTGIIASVTTTNPDINLTLGDWAAGISVSFASCWMDWVWAQKLSCVSLVPPVASIIKVEGKPGSLPYLLQIASCELGFPIYPLTILTQLYINQPCGVATEESSWGAIKSLF